MNREDDSVTYVCDFGDDWHHEVTLEEIIPVSATVKTPICVRGERRCPPEDVGGVSGYEDFLEVILDSQHEDYHQFVRWAGGHFIDVFDLKAANETLSRKRWPIRHPW